MDIKIVNENTREAFVREVETEFGTGYLFRFNDGNGAFIRPSNVFIGRFDYNYITWNDDDTYSNVNMINNKIPKRFPHISATSAIKVLTNEIIKHND